ncbi:T9SS type A sorting domain-containing protein [Flavobacterium subsaxonicum]|uniref:Secretion system C-terminal sorting domain-containing protein n=1 Tax=Flavobacterium subsaxonicum WB 4.1-42 = DSM 21790 TaxID=1121898 RepID=A0A0A2ME33_9FLAO|nr:T9SS type A sorting domain-containing protein [Flavobacterium subsaxonicum]KGO90952.1 hypothetical protein Q766_20655 [Flavobacterium subsaxonicum WB 4.1-42 = DSM 21790]
MKKITLALFLMGSVFVNAQTLTQNESPEVADGSTIACVSDQGFASSDNNYYRFYDLSDYGITADFSVSAVEFGIQQLVTETAGSYPITVTLYATTATFPTGFGGANYTQLAQETFDVVDQELAIFSAPISAVVPAGSDLVVQVSYEGDEELSTVLFLGSNEEGETAPSYLSSIGCEIVNPVTLASIGYPDVAMIINVVGPTAAVKDNALSAASVYPNPTTGVLNVQVPAGVTVNNAFVTDITGKVINVTLNNNVVNMSGLANGVYILTVNTDKGNLINKIVKQ